MNKKWFLIIALVSALILATPTAGCTLTPTPQNQQLIEIISVSGPLEPINPGGPIVEITLKNVAAEPIVSLSASLELNSSFNFDFDVSPSNPLLPDKIINSTLTLIGGGFSDNVSYPLTIEGNLESGTEYSYTEQVQIKPPQVQNPNLWPGVAVYSDSSSPITTRVNETFSILLPPASLYGWGWQNEDLSAFSLLETETVPGPDNEDNPFGPNAFLFQALESGSFQIILYVPSKPPQQLETFDIVVNP